MASWRRSRAIVLGVALLALVAVVALATRARTPAGGTGGTRQVDGDLLLQYAALVALVLAAVSLPFVVWWLWASRDDPAQVLPARGNWMRRLLFTTAVVSAVSIAFLIYRSHHQGHSGKATPLGIGSALANGSGSVKKQAARPAGFDWVPLIVILAVGLGGAGLRDRAARAEHPRRRTNPALAAAALSDALDDTLDDLRASPTRGARSSPPTRGWSVRSPLAGLPRAPCGGCREYLARVLSDLLHASAASVTRLTALFERAEFSPHEIGPVLKNDAIEALVAVRDELRASTT